MKRLSMLLFVACCCLLPGARGATSTPTPPSWQVTGSGHQNYRLDGGGDPVGADGATVSLSATQADPYKFGASVYTLDAAPYRGHTLRLSADLDVRDAARGAGLWLRADDDKNSIVGLVTSLRMPAIGTSSGMHREVRLDVPASAAHLLVGVILNGNGEATARHLHLETLAASTQAGVTPQAELDAAIRIVRTHALHAQEIDWDRFEPELHAMAKDAKTSVDTYPTIQALLAKLGDHHSFLMGAWEAKQEHSEGGASSPAAVELKPGGIGYIAMPGYRGMNAEARHAFVQNMVDAIGKQAASARCGWIVDLRHDGGGSMVPMLEGLRPLLGDQALGGFRDAKGHVQTFAVANPLDKSSPRGPALEQAPVAVLLGPHTASSGEVVAVAFRGRPRTRSFGEPTAGLSTANAGFNLPDGGMIFLTDAIDVDRLGQAYGGKLSPDEPVAPSASGTDGVLATASSWLSSSCGD